MISELAEAAKVFVAEFAFELPVAEGLANNLAGGGVFSGFDSGLEGGNLLAGEGDADFLDVGHWRGSIRRL